MDKNIASLIAKSSYPWWEWDILTNTVTFNDLKVTMLGYAAKDFVDKGYQAFTSLLHPDDYENTMSAMMKVLRKESRFYSIDYRIKAANGSYHWYMDRGYVIEQGPEGNPLKIRGIVLDLGAENATIPHLNALKNIIQNSVSKNHPQAPSLITLCSNCAKVKHTEQEWITISPTTTEFIGDTVSHGICPDCIRILYPEYANEL